MHNTSPSSPSVARTGERNGAFAPGADPTDVSLSGQPRPEEIRSTRRRVVTASFIGNFVEWFDYAVYGYLAVTITAVFFPESDPQTGLMMTFALFAISF